MTDIMERLKYEEPTGRLCLDARAEIARLRMALKEIKDLPVWAASEASIRIARKALGHA